MRRCLCTLWLYTGYLKVQGTELRPDAAMETVWMKEAGKEICHVPRVVISYDIPNLNS